MARPASESNIRIAVHDFPSKSTASPSATPITWSPMEHLNGHVAIQSTETIEIEKITIHLQGHSRVWIDSLGADGKVVREVSSYKFLHQSHDAIFMQCQKDVATETCECVADFRLLIPRWAIIPVDRVPDQCLDLPPSIFVGQSYKLHGEQWEYGQPNIEYQLVAQITFRQSTRDSGRLPQPEVQRASKLITIMPSSLPSPPTDLSDFPAEFISSESNSYNAMLSGTSYSVRLSTIEPSPVVLKPAANNMAMIPVHVEIDTVPGKSDLSTELPRKLRNLAFKVQPILRSKTFYSTVPFRKMPGQTMLTAKGALRLKDEMLKLTSHTLGASSWRYALGNAQAVSNDMSGRGSRPEMPTTWFTSVHVPVTVQSDLAPTFCSATAARHYSLIMRITLCGWKINEFVLEIPLQILHAQKLTFENAGLAIPGRIPGCEPASSWMEPERCPLEDTGEVVPSYS